MLKKILGLLLLAAIGYGGYYYFSRGYHTRPDIPEGSFSMKFKSGFRAIVLNQELDVIDRKYFGHSVEVPFYLEKAWSFCEAPTPEENEQILRELGNRPGERVDGVCRIDVDGKSVLRGIIASVPRL
ncbi:hypothetical protein [Celeribacter sp.]|uniref:hypothetical protein n=1 Tax=Celeribacter sp. TaxID=1890673 RepID=UPI003A958364